MNGHKVEPFIVTESLFYRRGAENAEASQRENDEKEREDKSDAWLSLCEASAFSAPLR